MEVIQQQLTWMEHVKNQETGISSLATYFINGYKKRVANSELHLKPGFIIDTEMTPKVPLFR
ncbi:hypothetical protein [Vagococcus sp.]|uniref:hypothetical protein n=1 Tax=Vagococcus sp. TaxID=1933889 RepID=UPI003F9C7FD0